MKIEHKAIRERLCGMAKPTARNILSKHLPAREYTAIYYADVEQENLGYIADFRLYCSESAVKKYRKCGYEKLTAIDFFKTNLL